MYVMFAALPRSSQHRRCTDNNPRTGSCRQIEGCCFELLLEKLPQDSETYSMSVHDSDSPCVAGQRHLSVQCDPVALSAVTHLDAGAGPLAASRHGL